MGKIAVVTDSVAIVPRELVQKYDIHVAPCHVIWDKVKYLDGVNLQAREFYQRLRVSKTLPTTDSAIQGELVPIFEGLRGKVDGILVIVLSGGLGAAYSSAMKAKEMVPDIPIEVIDSRLALMGEGFAVLAAAKAASVGASMEQVAKAVQDVLAKTHVYIALDTFEFLRRGGRVSFPKAIIASLLQVKPVMVIKDGKLEAVARPRTMPAAIETMVELMKQKSSNDPLHVSVMHADNPDGALALKKQVDKYLKYSEIITTEVTPIIGTHLGPGALSIAFYNE
jgi:DegV family protein with EDD domain